MSNISTLLPRSIDILGETDSKILRCWHEQLCVRKLNNLSVNSCPRVFVEHYPTWLDTWQSLADIGSPPTKTGPLTGARYSVG